MAHSAVRSAAERGTLGSVNVVSVNVVSIEADATERKAMVALVLDQGLRPDLQSAERFVASTRLRRLALADYQQRVEALRLHNVPLANVAVLVFSKRLKKWIVPRLAFLAVHACAPACYSPAVALRRAGPAELYVRMPATRQWSHSLQRTATQRPNPSRPPLLMRLSTWLGATLYTSNRDSRRFQATLGGQLQQTRRGARCWGGSAGRCAVQL